MNVVIKINTADLTEQVIHDLKEKYGSAELEIFKYENPTNPNNYLGE